MRLFLPGRRLVKLLAKEQLQFGGSGRIEHYGTSAAGRLASSLAAGSNRTTIRRSSSAKLKAYRQAIFSRAGSGASQANVASSTNACRTFMMPCARLASCRPAAFCSIASGRIDPGGLILHGEIPLLVIRPPAAAVSGSGGSNSMPSAAAPTSSATAAEPHSSSGRRVVW